MGRPVYPHELIDQDFSWLISNFLENHPNYTQVDSTCLPIVLVEGVVAPKPQDEMFIPRETETEEDPSTASEPE